MLRSLRLTLYEDELHQHTSFTTEKKKNEKEGKNRMTNNQNQIFSRFSE